MNDDDDDAGHGCKHRDEQVFQYYKDSRLRVQNHFSNTRQIDFGQFRENSLNLAMKS